MNKIIFAFITLFAVSLYGIQSADALRLTVKRVVFEGPKRAESITVINNGFEDVTYRVGWRHFVMTPTKSLNAIPEDQPLPPEVKPVVDMIRYAPRRFTVPAKSSQQVRLMLRMPANLPDGEYRSHFWIRPEPNTERIRAKANEYNEKTGRKKGVSIEMLTGVTMPVIVRKGNLGAKVTLSNLTGSKSPGFVSVSYALNRVGEKSTYGNLDYVCNRGSESEYLLRSTKGIAIYAETNQRVFNKKIEKQPNAPECSTLTVMYSEATEVTGAAQSLLTEGTINL